MRQPELILTRQPELTLTRRNYFVYRQKRTTM